MDYVICFSFLEIFRVPKTSSILQSLMIRFGFTCVTVINCMASCEKLFHFSFCFSQFLPSASSSSSIVYCLRPWPVYTHSTKRNTLAFANTSRSVCFLCSRLNQLQFVSICFNTSGFRHQFFTHFSFASRWSLLPLNLTCFFLVCFQLIHLHVSLYLSFAKCVYLCILFGS